MELHGSESSHARFFTTIEPTLQLNSQPNNKHLRENLSLQLINMSNCKRPGFVELLPVHDDIMYDLGLSPVCHGCRQVAHLFRGNTVGPMQ